MIQQHDKISENKTETVAANISGGKTAVQLKDNRKGSVVQHKLSEKPTTQETSVIIQKKTNKTGLPDNLKTGMENLSDKNLDHVKVHYNSSKPAAVQAHAYAQGSDIHIAPGQEKHLPHELGHVVQQMEGRVKPTVMVGNTAVNNDPALEQEATHMGQRAIQRASFVRPLENDNPLQAQKLDKNHTAQFHSMEHLGFQGINYTVMSQKSYGQWQKTIQAKSTMNGVHQSTDKVVVTQFQNSNEITQYFLSGKIVGGLVILEGLLALAAGAVILSSLTESAIIPGLGAVGVGISKIIRGLVTAYGNDKPSGKQKIAIDLLRGFEAGVALAVGLKTENKAGIVFGVAKSMRSLLHGVMDWMGKDNPSIVNKIAAGFAAALHWVEVIAVFTAGSIDLHSGIGGKDAAKGVTGGANIGIAASKALRAANQTAGAKKIISPSRPEEDALLANP